VEWALDALSDSAKEELDILASLAGSLESLHPSLGGELLDGLLWHGACDPL